MIQRVLAIAFIFVCAAVAWGILGATILSRTHSSSSALRGKVASTWGGPQEQRPAYAEAWESTLVKEESTEDGKRVVREKPVRRRLPLSLERSRLDVALALEHRQKGLIWYSTYAVGFQGRFTFRNGTGRDRQVAFVLPFPASNAVYDGLEMTVNGRPAVLTADDDGARVEAPVPAGGHAELGVKYRSRGMTRWSYAFGEKVAEVKDFALAMRTDFDEIDFPDNTLSPTSKQKRDGGWQLEWRYGNLLSGFPIAMSMPEKLQPGPLAGEISFFAPVSLFFFFFVIWLVTALRRIDLHPMNYFFIACAFFAFHLLMAYLVDHLSVHVSFVISAAVSMALVASYLRLVVGSRFAFREAAGAQFVYLVLFSYAFFFRGYTGLAITIGAILTLFVAMQATARLRWESLGKPAALPLTESGAEKPA
ncbi:MAG: inner membrane CreD family protein [Bryobacteraceae bacterium]|nr:inner membrane CreD family protein [Bryobacteraceae bacterium]